MITFRELSLALFPALQLSNSRQAFAVWVNMWRAQACTKETFVRTVESLRQYLYSSARTTTNTICLTLCCRALHERLSVVQSLGSFPVFYGTRRLITAFTRALHLYLSRARPIPPTPLNPISARSILMLSTHLRIGLPSGLYPSGFPTNNLYAFLFSPVYVTCSMIILCKIRGFHGGDLQEPHGETSQMTPFFMIILIKLGEEYKSCSSSLCNVLHPPVTHFLFGPNILISNLFSNTLSLCSYLNVRDQASQPYRTTGKIIVLYILIFRLFDSKWEERRIWTEW
jgi:hypothetical protein